MNKYENGVIKYQIDYERYKNGQANEIIKLLDEADAKIARYVEKTKGVYTKARYKEIASKLREISKELKSKVDDNIDVDGIIDYELQKEKKLLNILKNEYVKVKGGDINFIYPSKEQIRTSALFKPATEGLTYESYLNGIEAGLFKTWDSAVRTGYLTGMSTNQIVHNVMGGISQINKLKQAGTIQPLRNSIYANTRTMLQSFAEETRERVYKENEQYFGDGEYKYEYLATLDNRTCLVCGNFDQKKFKSLEDAPHLPQHRNCVLGDTLVSTVGKISKVYRRRYKGLVYRITTASGNVLSVTPNHPILTDKGFIRAQFLNVGDNVISNNGLETLDIIGENEKHNEALIKNVFSTFRKSPTMFSCTMPLTTEDLHNDVTHKKVNVVCTDRVLSYKENVFGFESIGKKKFIFGHLGKVLFDKSHKSIKLSFFNRNFTTFGSLVCRFGKMCNLFWGRILHPFNLLFSLISHRNMVTIKETNHSHSCITKSFGNSCNSDTLIVKFKNLINRKIVSWMLSRSADISVMQNVSDNVFGNTELACDILDRYSTQIKFDSIVSIDISFSITHVYNLETENSWYVANGIITHNCRCLLLPYFDIEGDTRSSSDGQKKASVNFEEWLKEQDAETQKEVLGKTRYELFKRGESISQFVDNGKVLTLDELKQRLGNDLKYDVILEKSSYEKSFEMAKEMFPNENWKEVYKDVYVAESRIP